MTQQDARAAAPSPAARRVPPGAAALFADSIPRRVPPDIARLAQRAVAVFACSPDKELTISGVAVELGVSREAAEECLAVCVKARLINRYVRGETRLKIAFYGAGEKLAELPSKLQDSASLGEQLVRFFAANPTRALRTTDIASQFNMPSSHVRPALMEHIRGGWIKLEYRDGDDWWKPALRLLRTIGKGP